MRFELQSVTGTGEIIKVEEGLVSEKFHIPERCLPEEIDNSCHPHLKDIEIPEVRVKGVSILIGKDVDYTHKVSEFWKPSSLYNLLAALGWVITEVVQGYPSAKEISVNLRELVEDFWKFEAFSTFVGKVPSKVEQAKRITDYPHRLTGP